MTIRLIPGANAPTFLIGADLSVGRAHDETDIGDHVTAAMAHQWAAQSPSEDRVLASFAPVLGGAE